MFYWSSLTGLKQLLLNMTNILRKLLPAPIKRMIAAHIRAVVQSDPEYVHAVEGARLYFPSHPGDDAYCVKSGAFGTRDLPVPPEELWVGYGPDAQTYISSGRRDVAEMARIVEESGASLSGADRILEFGCAAGRMLRHVGEFAPRAELWGVDLSARHVQWCVNNLAPAMQFATTTVVPHLPFEDRYFDFIFCGSVFTHIEDLQQSWLLELARILRPTGRLFITLHDEYTVKRFEASDSDHRLVRYLREQPVYVSNKNDFGMIVVGRCTGSQVFYHSDYFKILLPRSLGFVSHTPDAYGYQSAVVLAKK